MPHVELPQAEFKVVMLGDTSIGKTSLVLRFAEGHYRESSRNPTVGAFFITKRLSVQGITCKIQIWDTAGQEQFKRLAPMYYKNAAAAIVCYDLTSPKSFETLKYWIDELQRNVPAGSIVLAMCATKGDLTPHPDTTQAEQLADATGAMFMTTSAKENVNVEMLFQKVAERVLQFQKQRIDGGGVGVGTTNGVDRNNNIPVTLATTAVETPTRVTPIMGLSSSDGPYPPYTTQRRIATPPPEEKKSEADGMMMMRGQVGPNGAATAASPALADDDITVENKAESKESEDAVSNGCGSNMLMCGDVLKAEEMIGSTGQGCILM